MSVGIIIVNWNGRDLTEQFLESIQEHTEYSDYEIVVFDNDSDDGTPEMVRTKYPDVTLMEHEENIGFVGGENEGILNTEHDYYFLANNDCVVHSTGWLTQLVETMEAEPDIGIVGPDNEPDPSTFHGAAYWNGDTVDYAPESPHVPKEVDIVSGAQFLIDARVFDRVGLIDETFWPAFNEEIDFCHRAQSAGFKVVFEPRVLVEHLEGKTVDQDLDKYEINRKYGIRFRCLNYSLPKLLFEIPKEIRRLMNAPLRREEGLDISLRSDWRDRLSRNLWAYWWNIKDFQEILEGRKIRREVLETDDPHTEYWLSNRQTGD